MTEFESAISQELIRKIVDRALGDVGELSEIASLLGLKRRRTRRGRKRKIIEQAQNWILMSKVVLPILACHFLKRKGEWKEGDTARVVAYVLDNLGKLTVGECLPLQEGWVLEKALGRKVDISWEEYRMFLIEMMQLVVQVVKQQQQQQQQQGQQQEQQQVDPWLFEFERELRERLGKG